MSVDIKEKAYRLYPKLFVASAHLGGILMSIWMKRWDLLLAGILFGIPSTLLFYDLLPGGKSRIVRTVRKLIRL
jgi:hypothetical protein